MLGELPPIIGPERPVTEGLAAHHLSEDRPTSLMARHSSAGLTSRWYSCAPRRMFSQSMAIRTPWGCWLMKSARVRTVCGYRIRSGWGHPICDLQATPALRPRVEKRHVGHRRPFNEPSPSTSPRRLPHAEHGRRGVHDALGGVPLHLPENQRREQALQGEMQPVWSVHCGQTAVRRPHRPQR